jgi:hypothetical protein
MIGTANATAEHLAEQDTQPSFRPRVPYSMGNARKPNNNAWKSFKHQTLLRCEQAILG